MIAEVNEEPAVGVERPVDHRLVELLDDDAMRGITIAATLTRGHGHRQAGVGRAVGTPRHDTSSTSHKRTLSRSIAHLRCSITSAASAQCKCSVRPLANTNPIIPWAGFQSIASQHSEQSGPADARA